MANLVSLSTIVAIGVSKLKATATVAFPANEMVATVVSDETLPEQLRDLSIVSKITLANDKSPFPAVYYSTTAVSAIVTDANTALA
jgi:hypothetical protein